MLTARMGATGMLDPKIDRNKATAGENHPDWYQVHRLLPELEKIHKLAEYSAHHTKQESIPDGHDLTRLKCSSI